MAFVLKNLKLLASVGDTNLYTYNTDDSAATVDTANYFVEAVDFLKVGDIIIRKTGTLDSASGLLTAMTAGGFHFINARSDTAVDVTDALAFVVTDTD
ncbi:MAG: hypothetical protein FJX11_23970 [Alphaproteobacteria bacterium]|nr:hypothetical protein [Alphaproteobacteria bacterium]